MKYVTTITVICECGSGNEAVELGEEMVGVLRQWSVEMEEVKAVSRYDTRLVKVSKGSK